MAEKAMSAQPAQLADNELRSFRIQVPFVDQCFFDIVFNTKMLQFSSKVYNAIVLPF